MKIKKQRHNKLIIIAAVLSIVSAAICISYWRMRPIDAAELSAIDAVVEREECYLLCTDTDTLMAFTSLEGDSLLSGATTHIDSVQRQKVRQQAQWVNRWPVIPSCHGRLILHAADTASICQAGATKIRRLLFNQKKYIEQCLTTIKEQREQTDYYLRTHNVTEIGFDVVARTHQHLQFVADSLQNIKRVIEGIGNNTPLKVCYHAIYHTTINTGDSTVTAECVPTDIHNGMLVIRTRGNIMPDSISTRLTIYDTETTKGRLAKRPSPKIILPTDMRRDSIGLYQGEMDSIGMPHGYGKLKGHAMDYYEGEWEHGMRHGFGMALTPHKRMRIGEWKGNNYLGERITYTNERIYGIDISRHQHEKGRKRFKINWNNLVITHLGHISKKTIDGSVNYPISFIYIKSTEGTSIFNKYFYADYRAAKQHGYKVGTYHFFSTRTPGAKQAYFFLKKAKYQRGDFPPVLDIEPTQKQIAQMGGTKAMFAHIRKWLNMVEQAWGVKPILYVSQTFVNRYLPSAPDLMKKYNVWIARYGEYKPDVNLIYWQLCPDGRVKGIQTAVDINVFNGFEPEWQNFLGKLH